MNALTPPFPTNPSVGEWFGNWVWNGARWVCVTTAGLVVKHQVFQASGPYMPSPNLTSCLVECIGAGGAGGYVISVGPFSGAGGGGSGGRSIIALPAALVAGGVNVTVGTGNSMPVGSISLGGVQAPATTFGALCTANGGFNSYPYDHVNPPNYDGDSGNGAPPGVGDIMWPGSAGNRWVTCDNPAGGTYAIGGLGGVVAGGNYFALSQFGSHQGNDGYGNSGAGGSGAEVNPPDAAGTSLLGGRGADGICIVTEFCWGTPDDDCLNPPLNVNARVAVTHVPWPGPGPCPPGWNGGYGEFDGE